jgi:hypothetical protein
MIDRLFPGGGCGCINRSTCCLWRSNDRSSMLLLTVDAAVDSRIQTQPLFPWVDSKSVGHVVPSANLYDSPLNVVDRVQNPRENFNRWVHKPAKRLSGSCKGAASPPALGTTSDYPTDTRRPLFHQRPLYGAAVSLAPTHWHPDNRERNVYD